MNNRRITFSFGFCWLEQPAVQQIEHQPSPLYSFQCFKDVHFLSTSRGRNMLLYSALGTPGTSCSRLRALCESDGKFKPASFSMPAEPSASWLTMDRPTSVSCRTSLCRAALAAHANTPTACQAFSCCCGPLPSFATATNQTRRPLT